MHFKDTTRRGPSPHRALCAIDNALVSNIIIDTSAEATDTIDYVATDTAGNAATSTRTVIVDAPDSTESPTGSTSTRTIIIQAANAGGGSPSAEAGSTPL